MKEIFILLNPNDNAIDNLEQALIYLENKEYKHRYKWLIICLHTSLYSFLISGLKIKGEEIFKIPNRIPEIKKYEEAKIYYRKLLIEWWGEEKTTEDIVEKFTKLNTCNIISIKKAVKMFLKNKRKLKDNEEVALKEIIDYRNFFMHFHPGMHAIILKENILRDIISVIKYVALEADVIQYNSTDKQRLTNVLNKLENNLSSL